MKTNIEKALLEVTETLQNKVADYLDVNRNHIKICMVDTEICGEDYIDWDADEDDAMEGFESETYYRFAYMYREDARHLDYGDLTTMIWKHIEGEGENGRIWDEVMTEEEYEKLFEDKKSNPISMWYEEKED